MELNRVYNMDCLEGMKKIPDNSIDMILCDLPYGVTDCEWDNIIPFDSLWKQYKRITRPDAAIVLFSIQPFTTKLIQSNISNFKYCWYWIKNASTGFTFAKYQPMRRVEDICVFRYDLSRGNAEYFPKCREYLQSERKKSGKTLKELQSILNSFMTSHYFTNGKQFELPSRDAYKKLQTTGFFQVEYDELRKMYLEEMPKKKKCTGFTYNPQGVKLIENPKTKKAKNNKGQDYVYKAGTLCKEYTPKYTGYPHNLLYFDRETNRLHPTQKPLALCEYLIKTYTNEGDIVLDSCAGSGTTLLAAKRTGRKYIGFELSEHYYNVSKDRLSA